MDTPTTAETEEEEGTERMPSYATMVISAPYSPIDYKAKALEIAYMTPHHAGVVADQVEPNRTTRFQFMGVEAREGDSLLPNQRRLSLSGSRVPYSLGYQLFTGTLLSASILFLFADQNLLAPNLTAVARDFGFDDSERDIKLGGQIPFAFFVVGGFVSVVVGPLSDVLNRKNLYVWTCLVGTIPTLLTYWVRTFEQFFVLRTLTGVAVGGAFPLIYSLASDMTQPNQRAIASSAITVSMGMGSTLGQGVAGFIGPKFGWRLPFVIIALPNIFITALVVLLLEEPDRKTGGGLYRTRRDSYGRRESVDELDVSFARTGWSMQASKFLDVFRIRTNLLAFCQSMPGCLPWGVISAFLTDFLHEQRGMTVEGATGLMFVFGLGCFAGNLVGGLLGQWVYNRRKEWAAYLMAASTLVGALPLYWLIDTNTPIATANGGFTFLAAMMALLGGVAAFTGPLVRAFVMQVNSSRNRGTVFSVFMVADDLGKGLGPAVVSLLIPALGRMTAFNIAFGGWGLCAVFLFLMSFTIRADEEAVARQIRAEKLLRHSSSSKVSNGANVEKGFVQEAVPRSSRVDTIDI